MIWDGGDVIMETMRIFTDISDFCKKALYGVAFFLFCGAQDPVSFDYSPPVVFTGFINGTYDSLGGNRKWRNSCTMDGDTLRMFFFSNNFKEKGMIRDGDLIRIDVFPKEDSTDSSNFLTNSRVLFHMARYLGNNTTYTIPRNDRMGKVEMTVTAMDLVSGGVVEFCNIIVSAPPLTGGEMLAITKARIKGVIE